MEICFAANSTEYNCVFDFLFVLGQNEVTFDTVIKLNSIMFKWVNFIRILFLFWIIILNYYICIEYYFCFELLFLFRILFLFCYYICFVIISVFLLFLFVIFCFELVHITFSWPIFALHFFQLRRISSCSNLEQKNCLVQVWWTFFCMRFKWF